MYLIAASDRSTYFTSARAQRPTVLTQVQTTSKCSGEIIRSYTGKVRIAIDTNLLHALLNSGGHVTEASWRGVTFATDVIGCHVRGTTVGEQ
ncbi:hypothetical protein SCLCIDRAFT_1210453 [Scleroderma citrinum Foug A]|uniref:Uncharacterized protein n=1 Tax=Scleroderma citrinum Foug A TaxID=1036808 RepID=A0A0C3EGF5_9AGAM|nr:hypothetical protein SCLCIDRAFT_1210453 [Scleroderma citrinum Foug A]